RCGTQAPAGCEEEIVVVWWLVGAASAQQDSVVEIKVVGPTGNTLMQDMVTIPADRTLPAPDGKNALRVFIQTKETYRAIVGLEYGPFKDGHVKAKIVQSFELDPWATTNKELAVKKDKWAITAVLGHVWDAPKGVATDDTNKYVLAWDDAPMPLQ